MQKKGGAMNEANLKDYGQIKGNENAKLLDQVENLKKREHLLINIDKFNIPFIKYNPNYNIEDYITKEGGKIKSMEAINDFGCYFIDDVSIEMVEDSNK